MRASLIELEAVAGVARHGGFRAAAREARYVVIGFEPCDRRA